MTVTAPPRPPEPHDPVEREEVDDLEALIEEARQRTRRRRLRYAAATAMLVLIGVSLIIIFGRSGPSQEASAGLPAPAGAPDPNEAGSIVASYGAFQFGWVIVYDDGRVIWQRTGPGGWGELLEQRLTAAGVDLVRSGAVQPSAFLHGASLPEGAWADPEVRPYLPSKYAVLLVEGGLAHGGWVRDGLRYLRDAPRGRLPAALPAEARALLRGNERTYTNVALVYELIDHLDNVSAPLKPGEVFSPIENPEVTSEEARALRQTLTDAGFVGGEHGFYAGLFFFNSPDCEDRRRCPPELGITLAPILPHGEWVQWAS